MEKYYNNISKALNIKRNNRNDQENKIVKFAKKHNISSFKNSKGELGFSFTIFIPDKRELKIYKDFRDLTDIEVSSLKLAINSMLKYEKKEEK